MSSKEKTTVLYAKDQAQDEYEKTSIIEPLRSLVEEKTGVKRDIKLPKYISFTIGGGKLSVYIQEATATHPDGSEEIKNYVCMDMQSDNAAFEGWAICLKSWLPKEVEKVELKWDIPTKMEDDKKRHYHRFLVRAMRFKEAFDWFDVSENNRSELKQFESDYTNLNNNTSTKEPERKSKHDKESLGETDIEYIMVNEFREKLKKFYKIEDIDRQLPVGVKRNSVLFLTGGQSKIDLWGANYDAHTLSIIELKHITKTSRNIKVGIISELFLYSCVMRDIVLGKIGAPKGKMRRKAEFDFYGKISGIQKINAEMLAEDFHPLILNTEVFRLLNTNKFSSDIPIEFNISSYKYDNDNLELNRVFK